MHGLLARAALVAVALGALTWIGFGLRAVILNERGMARLEAAGDDGPDAETVRSARSLFQRASRANLDPTPELNEAALLIGLGRTREAAGLIESVARDNEGNVRAWGLLATATADYDDRRSTQASGTLLSLYGRVQGEPLPRGAVRSASGRRYVIVPGRVDGVVDRSRVTGGRAVFSGWATKVPPAGPTEILVVSRGRVIATELASRRRPDIARRFQDPRLGRSGFSFAVPLSLLAGEREDQPDVYLLGAAGGEASLLSFDCKNEPQDLGC